MELKSITTDVLEVTYEAHGPADGAPVILLHGFPYDPRCFDEVAPPLAAGGCRVLVPYLRGYGATRFLSATTPRSGEQAALGHDLLQFMDALAIPRALQDVMDAAAAGLTDAEALRSRARAVLEAPAHPWVERCCPGRRDHGGGRS